MTTINAPVLHWYTNGNCDVAIFADGSKKRMYQGDPTPEFPESIDLKITDYCDAGCRFCHESSTTRGKHASAENVMGILEGLPAGVEVAIGGGNPLSHPQLEALLMLMRGRGLVPNLTVNTKHFKDAVPTLRRWQKKGLLYGVGVSTENAYDAVFRHSFRLLNPGLADRLTKEPDHLVYHLIAGIASPLPLTSGTDTRILVLGYKAYGFGRKFDQSAVTECLHKWRYWLPRILKKCQSVSFDNLAVRQLHVRDVVGEDAWKRHYMGDDGQFTMYADAVRMEYAPSSTSRRVPANGMSAREFFPLLAGEDRG